jgi:hypothetical protein
MVFNDGVVRVWRRIPKTGSNDVSIEVIEWREDGFSLFTPDDQWLWFCLQRRRWVQIQNAVSVKRHGKQERQAHPDHCYHY